ncbi:HEXXH motif-containing putative peptide modification protein [Streptomyces sp. NPDC051020]|uniref:aKG-HExxH-type peptide beta-hydroxylase n=1 Tax=Streptomyces sp. NPDC051020 TaxID=3155409 RepID=UPI003442C256
MSIAPHAEDAFAERAHLLQHIQRLLPSDQGETSPLPADLLSYPGFISHAYEISADLAPAADLAEVRRHADASAARTKVSPCSAWAVDLPAREPHSAATLQRAIQQLDSLISTGHRVDVTIAQWSDQERRTFCAASCFLAEHWPAMLDELRHTVRQVTLLDGVGIAGFSNITAHGVIFLNRQRLRAGSDGLPGVLRLLEGLVHEGTHNRYNAADLHTPFLIPGTGAQAPVVQTPLRPDPRPLMGLFQQLIVLVRCIELYARFTAAATNGTAIQDRQAVLSRQAYEAYAECEKHRALLTDAGAQILADAFHRLNTSPTT